MFKKMTPQKIPTGEGGKTPEPKPETLLDVFATWASAPLRKPLCKKLTLEFNALEAQAMDSVRNALAYQAIGKRTAEMKQAIYDGGVAGVHAMAEAQRFILRLRLRGLDAV